VASSLLALQWAKGPGPRLAASMNQIQKHIKVFSISLQFLNILLSLQFIHFTKFLSKINLIEEFNQK